MCSSGLQDLWGYSHAAHRPPTSTRLTAHPPIDHPPTPPSPPVQDWDWSPNAADATLCAYQAEEGNLPARVVIMRFPEREELRQKNLFSVAGELISIRWISTLGFGLLCAGRLRGGAPEGSVLSGLSVGWHGTPRASN